MRKHPRKFDRNSELVGRRRHLSGIEDGDGGASTRKNGVMSSPGDAMLARGAQAGDAISLGILFERHRARLHAVALGMLGHGPDAEDAVQDAIVIAIRRIGELREPAAAGGWLVAIVVNVCRARLRRRAPEPLGADAADLRGALDSVHETVERDALRDWVWAAVERLPEPQRVAIMLRHFSTAHSYDAIADICDVPLGTVRSRLNTARKQLADQLLATAATAHTDATDCAIGHSRPVRRCWPSSAAGTRRHWNRCTHLRSPSGWPTTSSAAAAPASPQAWHVTSKTVSPPALCALSPANTSRSLSSCSRTPASSRCTAHPPSPSCTITTPAAPTGSSPTTRHARSQPRSRPGAPALSKKRPATPQSRSRVDEQHFAKGRADRRRTPSAK